MSELHQKIYEKYNSLKRGDRLDISGQISPLYRYKYAPFLEHLDRSSQILDLGCGSGSFMEFLSEEGFTNIEEVDISQEQIQLAFEKGFDVKKIDANIYLEEKSNTYDAIIANDFIEHVNKNEVLQVLQKIRKSLKENGILIIKTPNGQGLFPQQVIFISRHNSHYKTPKLHFISDHNYFVGKGL